MLRFVGGFGPEKIGVKQRMDDRFAHMVIVLKIYEVDHQLMVEYREKRKWRIWQFRCAIFCYKIL